MIVSFYSYKGGVGRTQLCANIAAYLCYKKGKRVLLWDWDYEAPGLHFFFGKENKDIKINGTLEILENYVSLMRSKSGIEKEDLSYVTNENILNLDTFDTVDDDSGKETTACIDLLPAGNLNDNFSSRINDFNWFEFYDLLDGINYMELLKDELRNLPYDYIFIDSRTGISDYSGICNIQLPDMNVFLMAANKQNFNGCSRIADQIINSEYVKKGYRKPFVMPVLSRLDRSHPEFERWITEFTDRFAHLMPQLDPNLEKEFYKEVFEDVYLQETLLEYVQAISAGENLLFTKEQQRFSKVSFERQFINIAGFIQKLDKEKSINIDELIDKDTWLFYAKTAVSEKLPQKAAMAFEHADENDKANELGGTPNTWVKKGNDYFLKDNKEKALDCYKKAIELKPNYLSALLFMGVTYMSMEDFKNAIKFFNKTIQIDPNNLLAYQGEGIAYCAIKEFDKSIVSYQQSLEINPDQEKTWLYMGDTYRKREDYAEAIRCYRKAVELKPDQDEAWNKMGITYRKKEDYAEAIRCYQRAIEIKPDKEEAWYNMGNAHGKKEDYSEAIRCYQRAVEIKPDKEEAWYNMGNAHGQKEDYSEAIRCYQKAIEIKPDKEEAWYNMGNALSEKEDYTEAIRCYQKAIELKPDQDEAWYNMGIAHRKKEDYSEAIRCYQKVIEIKPDEDEAWYNMGNAYNKKEDYSEGIRCYQKAIELKPDKDEVWHNMGIAYGEKEDYSEAIRCYQKALEIKPSNDDGWSNLGSVYGKQGNYEEAIKCYQKAIEINPKDQDYQMNLGWQYLLAGELELSQKYLSKSVELGSHDYGNMNLGHIHFANGNKAKALEVYQLSIDYFKDKKTFFIGYADDFQYLEQYGVSKQEYQQMEINLKAYAGLN